MNNVIANSLVGMRRLFRLLDPQVVLAAVTLVVVEAGLRLTTLPRLARVLGIRLGSHDEAPVAAGLPAAWIERRRVAVGRVCRHSPFGDTCLRRALVLGRRIRRLQPTLVIGVRRDEDGAVAAHAWLVVDGATLDPAAAAYAALG